jgi:hypothetical protein
VQYKSTEKQEGNQNGENVEAGSMCRLVPFRAGKTRRQRKERRNSAKWVDDGKQAEKCRQCRRRKIMRNMA